jgi:hypothetical protein
MILSAAADGANLAIAYELTDLNKRLDEIGKKSSNFLSNATAPIFKCCYKKTPQAIRIKQALDFTEKELDVTALLKRLRVLEGLLFEGFNED